MQKHQEITDIEDKFYMDLDLISKKKMKSTVLNSKIITNLVNDSDKDLQSKLHEYACYCLWYW